MSESSQSQSQPDPFHDGQQPSYYNSGYDGSVPSAAPHPGPAPYSDAPPDPGNAPQVWSPVPGGGAPGGHPPYGGPAVGPVAAHSTGTTAAKKLPRGTWRIVVGIVCMLIGAPQLIRGLSLTLLSIVRPAALPEGTAYAVGLALPGAIFVAIGLVLAVKGARNNNARRQAAYLRQF